MNEHVARLAINLFELGAIKIARQGEPGFRLKLHETHPDAPLSPIYLNLRTPDNPKPGPLTPEVVDKIGREMWYQVAAKSSEFSLICGVPNAGDPFAVALKRAIHNWSFGPHVIRLRKETKTGGRRVTGLTEPVRTVGDVLLVDDLITGADSKLEAIEGLANAGLPVRDCVVVVDREQGGREQLAANNIRLHSLATLSQLLEVYTLTGRIKQPEFARVWDYLRSPREASTA